MTLRDRLSSMTIYVSFKESSADWVGDRTVWSDHDCLFDGGASKHVSDLK